MKTRRFVWLVIFAMVFMSLAPSAGAAPQGRITPEQEEQNQKVLAMKAQIISLLDQLGQVEVLALLPSNQGTKQQEALKREMQTHINQLEALGATRLTEAQVQEIQIRGSASDATPNVVIPPSTDSVEWWSVRYTWTMPDGQKYDIQELYARGKNGYTNLAKGADNVVLYKDASWVLSGVLTIASIYVQKALGFVPVVRWAPYELLFSDYTGVVNNSHYVTYRSLSTVCFSYVKPHGYSDDHQFLSFRSNYVNIASTHVLAGYRNGMPYTKSTDKTNSASADKYANAVSAVQAYLDPYAPRWSYVSSFTFFNPDMSKKIEFTVINPDNPTQIY